MLDLILIVAGLGGLIWSSDKFVDGAASIARQAGISPLIIGMTIVSLGTSAPEVVVSIIASLSGSGELAVGNALGSNITNIGLVLGVTLLIRTIAIDTSTTLRELPQMVAITVIAGALMIDGVLSVMDGALLLFGLSVFLYLLAQRQSKPTHTEATESKSRLRAWVTFTIGLVALIASSRLLVIGAVNVATTLGVSELVIGLTIVAIGTSLPELAASVVSAMKGHADIAIGAIVGSNVYNLLVVLAAPGLLGPLALNPNVMARDWPATMLTTTLLFVLAWFAYRCAVKTPSSSAELGRRSGVLFLAIYVTYIGLLFMNPDFAS
jgi:cation:H+ antiporter